MSAVLDVIAARRSEPLLLGPGPTCAELEQMLHAAGCAPDHGRKRPWRFFVIEDEARERLGDLLAAALSATRLDAGAAATDTELEVQRRKPLRAPTIVAIAAVRQDGPVPWWEQLAAAAAATQNMLLAATTMGLGSIWRTGALLEHPCVKDAFGLAARDRLVGLVFLGRTPSSRPASRARPSGSRSTVQWVAPRQMHAWLSTCSATGRAAPTPARRHGEPTTSKDDS